MFGLLLKIGQIFMIVDIQRICIKAKPSSDNKDYYEWQTATICMFIPENDKMLALNKGHE